MTTLSRAHLVRYGLTTLPALGLVIALTGCEFLFAPDRSAPPDHAPGLATDGALHVVNATTRTLFVGAYEQGALVRIASVFTAGPDEPGLVAPGATAALPDAEPAPGDTTVFYVFVPSGAAVDDGTEFRLAATLTRSYDALAADGFRLTIAEADLTHDHLFGDRYHVLTPSDGAAGPDVHAPRLDGETLRVWVGYGGCSEGAFGVTTENAGDETRLALYFDYPLPPGSVDCERYNMRPLAIRLATDAWTGRRVVLLNPNPGADPYHDAYLLR